MRRFLFSLSLFCLAGLVLADSTPVVPKDDVRKGWFFYDDPAKEEPTPVPSKAPTPPKPQEQKASTPASQKKEDPCQKRDTWVKECGFVDPGTDFEFQAKQRDELMVAMSMAGQDPKVVEAFQYYVRWATNQAIKVSNMWTYNMVNNKDLDPNLDQPISSFGINMVRMGEKQVDRAIMRDIAENGELLFFTQSSCGFCHSMLKPIFLFEQNNKVTVTNVPVDGKCIKKECEIYPDIQKVLGVLNVDTVPSVYLIYKPNTVIKVASGMVDAETLLSRLVNFYKMNRNAILKGTASPENGNMDFSATEGRVGSQFSGPSEADVRNLLKSVKD